MIKELESKKLDLIQWLSTIEDDETLNRLLEIRQAEVSNWWAATPKEQQESIDVGLRDAKQGKLQPHSEARKIYEKWL
ncbi:MAG: hypothetical protein KI790_06895 [Cyclobacteriaceae bacterium]|nr:hypothetical protein [Cyclobacteriaceae bacterium HetDA_MAG_MS6]